MVERPNVKLYKVELYLLKIIPIVLACIHLANTVLSYYGIDIILFSYIGSVSLIPLIFLYMGYRDERDEDDDDDYGYRRGVRGSGRGGSRGMGRY